MKTEIDLKELAIDRETDSAQLLRTRRHLLTRYVLPAALLLGFLGILAWAARDFVFPPRKVTISPVLVSQSAIQQEGSPLFKAAGWVEPRPTEIHVAALAPGVVEKLLVVEDQAVKAGQPIAELVKDDAILARNRARANLKLRQSEMAQAQAALVAAKTRLEQPVHLEADLREAEANLAKVQTRLKIVPFEILRAEAELKFAIQDHVGKVSAKGGVSGLDIERASSQAESARAQVAGLREEERTTRQEAKALQMRSDALEKKLELLADEIEAKDEAEARVQAAAARVEQEQVVVDEAELRLRRMTIRAPVTGRVFRLIAFPGMRTNSMVANKIDFDTSSIVTMYQPDHLQVRVDVRFEDIPKVQLNQPVRIENPAIQSPLRGEVLFISSEADIQKNTLEVKVAIPEPPAVFRPDMLVDVTFLAPKRQAADTSTSEENRIHIPQQFVQRDEAGTYVWVADQSAHVARRIAVTTGATSNNAMTEILSGLTISSRLIASGTEGLQDGDKIKVVGTAQQQAGSSSPGTTNSDSPTRTLNRLPQRGAEHGSH